MEKIPAEFLEDAIKDLLEITDELRPAAAACQTALPPTFLQKLFRLLHTIKGSAQTFGLSTEGRIAHKTEGFLEALREGRVLWSAESEVLLTASLETLANNFSLISAGKPAVLPVELIEKLEAISGKTGRGDKDLPLPENFPTEFSDKLSASEMQALGSAWDAGKEILILEFGIDEEGFAAKFKQVRSKLEGAAEVVAVASGERQTSENKAVFRFLAASKSSASLIAPVREFSGRVLFQKQKKEGEKTTGQGSVSGEDGRSEINEAILHGKKAAEMLGKNVKFLAGQGDMQIPGQLSKAVSIILLHLVRNAVDHGIEFPLERAVLEKPAAGTVEISTAVVSGGLKIKVCDDGRGIEDKGNIFAAGYSTAPFVTELSGRGIGLDAVVDAVHNAKGTIKVESVPGHGASFEIFLPLMV
jgi:chemotaxis protein histidine kinase CheA